MRLTVSAALALVFLGLPLIEPLHAMVRPLPATTCRDSTPGTVRPEGLFHDGGPLYLQPSEPEPRASVTLTLRTFACNAATVTLSYRLTADAPRQSAPLTRIGHDATGRYDLWRITLRVGPPGSAFTYRFSVQNGSQTIWLGDQGIAFAGPGAGSFRIAPGFHTPRWAQNAIFYQIFPDRFRNGNPKNDVHTGESTVAGNPVLARDWSNLPETPPKNRDFFGGDLAGIRQELQPYLAHTLGVNALYLNPIFQAPSNHKYDTQDYTRVDPHFGTNGDLAALTREAHAAGMHVILDGVFNHTGDTIRWFNKEGLYPPQGAFNTKKSPWYSFYTFTSWPSSYETFFGYDTLPKLNYGSAAVRDTIYRKPTSIMQTYLRPPYNIDGWRLDAAVWLNHTGTDDDTDIVPRPETQEILAGMRQAVKPVNPQALLIGEVWKAPRQWLDGRQVDGTTNYAGFTDPVSQWLAGATASGDTASMAASGLDAALRNGLATVPRPAQLVMLNSLSTHDIPRFLNRAGEDPRRLNLAQILQMTFVGAPCLYYGDEIGTTGGKDPDNRRTFNWNQRAWNRGVLSTARRLIALRRATAVLRTGSFTGLLEDDAHNGYAFGRWQMGQRAVVVLNADSHAHTYRIDVTPVEALPGTVWQDALRGGTVVTARGGTITVSLPAESGTVVVQTDSR